jgi:hypothetical protein
MNNIDIRKHKYIVYCAGYTMVKNMHEKYNYLKVVMSSIASAVVNGEGRRISREMFGKNESISSGKSS